MLARSVNLLLVGAAAFTTVHAQYAGNEGAVKACEGFIPGAIKCLTDVSYVVCRGDGYEVEQFVAAGTHCEQGVPYERLDMVNAPGVATATRIFTQNSPDPSSRFAAAVVPASTPAVFAPASSAPAGSASSSSVYPTEAANSASASPAPASSTPAPSSPAASNTVVPGTFATVTTPAAA